MRPIVFFRVWIHFICLSNTACCVESLDIDYCSGQNTALKKEIRNGQVHTFALITSSSFELLLLLCNTPICALSTREAEMYSIVIGHLTLKLDFVASNPIYINLGTLFNLIRVYQSEIIYIK